MAVELQIPTLSAIGKWQDYRQAIYGDSFSWGPVLVADKVDFVVMHHSVTAQTAKSDGNWRAECDKIAHLHVDGRGWGGIGYRLIICSDGTVAYVGDLSHGGSNVANNNDHEIGICFVGDFTKELPTANQVHSAYLLCTFLLGLEAFPQLTGWDCVIGHQDTYQHPKFPGATATACPGSNWKVAGDNLRTRIIQDNWSGYPSPSPVVATPPPAPPPSPTPPPVPPTPPVDPCENIKKELDTVKAKLYEIDTVMNGSGWWWVKYRKVKEALSR